MGSNKSKGRDISYYTYDLPNVLKYIKLLEKHRLPRLVYTGNVSSKPVIDVHPSFSVGVNSEYALSEYHRLHKVSSLVSALAGVERNRIEKQSKSIVSDNALVKKQFEQKVNEQQIKPEPAPIKSSVSATTIKPDINLPPKIEEKETTKPTLTKEPEKHKKSVRIEKIKEKHVKTSLNKNIVLKRSSIDQKKLDKRDKITSGKNKTNKPNFLEKATMPKSYNETQSRLSNLLASKSSKIDAKSLQSRMLQLTKQLFRSKSVSERESIKIELSIIRQLLETVKKTGAKKTSGKQLSIKSQIKNNLLTAIISKQNKEFLDMYNDILYEFKDTIHNFKRDYSSLLNKSEWYKISSMDEFNKKTSKLNMILTNFESNLVSRCKTETKQLEKKHMLELNNYINSSKIKKLPATIEHRKEKINGYTKKMDALCSKFKDEISKIVETIKNNSVEFSKTFSLKTNQNNTEKNKMQKQAKEETQQKTKQKEKTTEIVSQIETKKSKGKQADIKEKRKSNLSESEINHIVNDIMDMDEQTLMYYIYNHVKPTYRDYNKGTITIDQVLTIARRKMAEDRGMTKEMINKYFAS